MKKKKLFLPTSYDFELVGIVSSSKEYKLVWSINQITEFPLKKVADVRMEFSGNHTISVSHFVFESEHITVDLLKNRANERSGTHLNYLLEELKQFDFLLKIQDLTEQYDASTVSQTLKKSSEIDFTATIPVESLKAKDNLIF